MGQKVAELLERGVGVGQPQPWGRPTTTLGSTNHNPGVGQPQPWGRPTTTLGSANHNPGAGQPQPWGRASTRPGLGKLRRDALSHGRPEACVTNPATRSEITFGSRSTYWGNTGNDIRLQYIPEPSTALLAGATVLLAFDRRRR